MVKEHDFLKLFEKFISDTHKGRRLKKDGTRVKQATSANYVYTYKLISEFCIVKQFSLKIPELRTTNKREFNSVKNYWKKFYRLFTDFLYKDKELFDNYVGLTIKNIRVFFNWLKNEKGFNTGDFYKNFYARKEEIPVITLSRKQLLFLIFDTAFEKKLSTPLQRSKDILVFGCTVGLRISDLMNLQRNNIEIRDENIYLTVKSQKTRVNTRLKLPGYALDILKKYEGNKKSLLPKISLFRFNKNIKRICEIAEWTQPLSKKREKKGQAIKHSTGKNNTEYRFCDIVSSHIMRRTAVTTLLSLGVPEMLVRKMSGHSDNSRAFYRYVEIAQGYMDNEIEKAYEKLTLTH